MEETFVGRQIKRVNRNLLLSNLVLIGILLATLGANLRYLKNFVSGCQPISADALAAISNPDSVEHFFVTVSGDKTAATGEQETENGVPKSQYLLLRVGKRALVVKAAPSATEANLNFSGALVMADQGYTDIRGGLQKEAPEIAAMLLPYMMDAVDYRDDGYWGLGIGIPLFALALWNLSKWRKRMAEPASHPIMKQLQHYGDPTRTAHEIDLEVRQGITKIGKAQKTANWVLYPYFFGMKFTSIPALVWIYKKRTKHYHYFIPTGSTYSAVLVNRYGSTVEIQLKEKKTDELLGQLTAQAPWVIAGFNAELQSAWKSNPASIVQAADNRKSQAARAAGSSS